MSTFERYLTLWVALCIVAGVAPGAALSGVVVESAGASAAYLVSLGAGLVAALAAQALPRAVPAPTRIQPSRWCPK